MQRWWPVAGASLVVGLVVFIYWEALHSHFFNDDFHWLNGSWDFRFVNFFNLDRYDHFYRPVIELYFLAGMRLFGCDPLAFHWSGLALHLVMTLLVVSLARQLSLPPRFSFVAGLLFAVQPGPVEAVAWVGAITDLLPGVWYVLTLGLHVQCLKRARPGRYVAMLASFAACLLTHESSATLLPAMVAADIVLRLREPLWHRQVLWQRVQWYAPFALLLAGYLVIEFIVNSRSYLVREGHYEFGGHAAGNVLNYIKALIIWERGWFPDVVVLAAIASALWWGTTRVRFFIVLLLLSLLPVLFFTWGIASRYLYVPAAAFALLVAELLWRWHETPRRWLTPRGRQVAIAVVVAALTVRSTVFARRASADFRDRTSPYARLDAAVRHTPPGLDVVSVGVEQVEGIPELYLEPAVRTLLCRPDVRVEVGRK